MRAVYGTNFYGVHLCRRGLHLCVSELSFSVQALAGVLRLRHQGSLICPCPPFSAKRSSVWDFGVSQSNSFVKSMDPYEGCFKHQEPYYNWHSKPLNPDQDFHKPTMWGQSKSGAGRSKTQWRSAAPNPRLHGETYTKETQV